jgi:hypothetical protein
MKIILQKTCEKEIKYVHLQSEKEFNGESIWLKKKQTVR